MYLEQGHAEGFSTFSFFTFQLPKSLHLTSESGSNCRIFFTFFAESPVVKVC